VFYRPVLILLVGATMIAGAIWAPLHGGDGGAPAAGVSYYVDCGPNGSDSYAGTSKTAAWKTVTRANSAPLGPGDRLLLRRGCVWNSQRLEAGWTGLSTAPIVISAYGKGAKPLIKNGLNQDVRVTGSWQIFDHLSVSFDATQFTTCGEPLGDHYGFNFQPGAHDNTIRWSEAFGEMAGIHIAAGASKNRVLHNDIHDNRVLVSFNANPEVDQGAWGVLVNGDYNEIAYNSFHDNAAVCQNQGWVLRSKSINIYAAVGNSIHHNLSTDRVFAELGSSATVRTSGTQFAYNVFASARDDSRFVTTRGPLDHSWGPVYGTTVSHNTMYQTGSGSQGVVCGLGCDATILTLESNVVWAEWKGLYSDLPVSNSGNVFWNTAGDPLIDSPQIDPSTEIANPEFVDPAADNFRVLATSPAVDSGAPVGTWRQDFYGTPLPQGSSIDRGATEQ
jgi:hypothetical protein